MFGIEKKLICLNLNSNWKAIGYKSVKKAIIDLVGSEKNPTPSALAIDISYDVDENGDPIYESLKLTPVTWSEWCELPVRPRDLSINTPKKEIRAPTVIIAINYDKMPVLSIKGKKPKRKILFQRDGGRCGYTNALLRYDECSIDHVIPKSRGGADTYENAVITSKRINCRKGNRLNEEVGLKLIKKPTSPKPMLASDSIKTINHPDWLFFIEKK